MAAVVTLKRGKARPFFGRHPWVLSSAVARVEPGVEAGQVVDLVSHEGQWIAHGLFNPNSNIRVRLYSWTRGQAFDASLLKHHIDRAVELRQGLGYDDPQGATRVVFSDSDGLSGLVVDRFGEYLSVQIGSLAIQQRLEPIINALESALSPRGIYLRADPATAPLEGIEIEPGWVHGAAPAGPIDVIEHGIRYAVDPAGGQKTGLFLDQRVNRRVAASHARGRRVLDVYCYYGGFAFNALKGGASSVEGIDSSAAAIERARETAERNGLPSAAFTVADAMPTLDRLVAHGERYGMVVLDPPKFARGRGQVDSALRAYQHLNRRAMELLEPGGILVTCCCSGSVSREDFRFALSAATAATERTVQILEERGASPDHPVSATCLETDYLKCLICRVV